MIIAETRTHTYIKMHVYMYIWAHFHHLKHLSSGCGMAMFSHRARMGITKKCTYCTGNIDFSLSLHYQYCLLCCVSSHPRLSGVPTSPDYHRVAWVGRDLKDHVVPIIKWLKRMIKWSCLKVSFQETPWTCVLPIALQNLFAFCSFRHLPAIW